MATLVLARTFLPDYAKLERPVRQQVDALLSKFREATYSGPHLEKYQNSADPRACTVRVNQQYRGIVIRPEEGDTFILTRVLKHDEADKWMMRNTFSVNERTGALEVTDVVGIDGAVAELTAAPDPSEPSLFASIADKDLVTLGVDPKVLPLLAKVTSTEELDALTVFMPDLQSDALHLLALGFSVEDVWSQLVAVSLTDTAEIDTEDLTAAAARDVSKSMFYVAADDAELMEVVKRPFELWRTFLHPTQQRWVDRHFNGPARVTGGAGTGKTVVAMHRARWLADAVADASTDDVPERVLLTTYTTSLAEELTATMKTFCRPDTSRHLDVMTVDRLAHQVWSDAHGRKPRLVPDLETFELWEEVIDDLELPYSREFMVQEWEQVVLAHSVRSRADYFAVPRAGRGVAMNRRQRAAVWGGVEAFLQRLESDDRMTFLQLVDAAAEHLAGRSVKPYVHVLVDEAQDLHPAHWRLLRAAVDEGPDDLFIVGDTHQRIYDNRVSLSKLGIRVTGRSHRLRINYRTTEEILRWSLTLLTGETFDDMDEGAETLAGYRSLMHGTAPEVVGYDDAAAEVGGLVAAVQGWLADGLHPAEIGVAGRARRGVLSDVKDALVAAGVPVRSLTATTRDAVAVGTMHAMKGREFRAVAIVDASDGTVPSARAVTRESTDALQHSFDMQRERCLMYVACTRARETLRVSWHGVPSEFLPGP